MKKVPVLIAAVFFVFTPAFAQEDNTINLGFYEIAKPNPVVDWVCDETEAVNHGATFVNVKSGDVISVSFYVLTRYEKQLGGEDEIIRFVDRRQNGLRRYRYLKNLDLVLVFALAPANSRNGNIFDRTVNSLRVYSDFPISPCVRLGRVKEQFQIIAEQEPSEVTNRYAEMLRAELNGRLEHHDTHCTGPINYLLGVMECYNSRWELYGAGFDSKKAMDYFQKAHEARPAAADPGRAIQIVKEKMGAVK
ncbi:MAG: hypothetical protein HZC17_01525 [Candidatus Omnitrophica bacterium]|nr:hypothetical protein [Candidatus Omnitrophota bacterium]